MIVVRKACTEQKCEAVNGRRASRLLATRARDTLPPPISLAFFDSTAMDSSRAQKDRRSRVGRLIAATQAPNVLRMLDAMREVEEAKELFAINDAGKSCRGAVESLC